ncbi:MAG: PBP1A family penicillin-binding protein [Candidatus Dadabacteria bacterium]|nr:MAG: PBP1A family penicillin-binding protein [Candidatus Dadabacteria bacterium]
MPQAAIPRRRGSRAATFLLLAVPPLLAAAALAGWLEYLHLERVLEAKFRGRRWDFPSRVYADATPLVLGRAVRDARFLQLLDLLGYRRVEREPRERGEYRFTADGRALDIRLHVFDYPTHREPGRYLRLWLNPQGRIVRIVDRASGAPVGDALLEPVLIAGLHGGSPEERRVMSLDEIPAPLVRAVIAVEDRRFFEHPGIDLRGLARALVADLKAGSLRQGGSTITQQLMKNFFLTNERTITRKLREAAMALIAERRFSKREILENYLNEIYFGRDGRVAIHGVWAAARHYFGREPAELTLGQMATLAGMIRAPNAYSPHKHPERALARRNLVLRLLRDLGDIDEVTYRKAVAEPLGAVPPRPRTSAAPYFVDAVRRELAGRFPRPVLETEGFAIFTTLDVGLQRAAERAVREGLADLERRYPRLAAGKERLEAALVAVRPQSGAIVALVGGRSYRDSPFNRALDARRQPGSVFKPVVYAAALSTEHLGARHFTPATLVEDAPLTWRYDHRVWSPSNYEDVYHGWVTVRRALEQSLNTATARIARDVGIEAIRGLAVRMGADPKLPALPAIALGGWEMTPIEVARIYSVLANAGLRATMHAVREVADRRGHRVEGHRLAVERVLSPVDAYLVTHLLEGVIEHGTGRGVRRLGLKAPAAGKTGTTNEYNDAWFAGYTPDLLAVVWVGFDHPRSLGLPGAAAALPIWTRFMKEALAGRQPLPFRVPDGVVFRLVDPDTGSLATPACPAVVREAFVAGEEPRRPCPLHAREAPALLLWR